MTILNVARTVTLCYGQYGILYRLNRPQILMFMNVVQQMAYDKDMDYFLNWDEYITIYKEITMSSTGYTNAITTDVGKTVVGGTSGAEGTLISYDNDTGVWVVDVTDGEFLAEEDLTITTGTGAATVESLAAFKGPYSAPDDCRKIRGVTALTAAQRYGNEPVLDTDNYGTSWMYGSKVTQEKNKWANIDLNQRAQTFTFLFEPSEVANTYRLVYYVYPPEIANETDDDNYVIPDSLRYTLMVGAVGALAQSRLVDLASPVTPEQALSPFLDSFWNSVSKYGADTPGNNTDTVKWI